MELVEDFDLDDEPVPSTDPERAELLRRFLTLRDAVEVLGAIRPGGSDLEALHARVPSLTRRLLRLRPPPEKDMARMAEELAAAATAFHAISRKLGAAELGVGLRSAPFAAATMERFGALVAEDPEPGPDRARQLQAILVGIASTAGAVRPPREGEVESALERLGLRGAAPADVRERALAFFSTARALLPGLNSPEELLDSGILGDIAGFKLALRDELLDPVIMRGAVELDLDLAGREKELLSASPRSAKRLQERRAEAEARANTVLDENVEEVPPPTGSLPAAPVTSSFRKPTTGSIRIDKPAPVQAKRSAPWLPALVIVACAGALWATLAPSGQQLRTLPAAELRNVSPLLKDGAIAGGVRRAFVGHIPKDSWDELGYPERQQAAEQVRDGLKAWSISTGVVFAGDALAIQLNPDSLLVP